MTHGRACAARIRKRAEQEGWPLVQIAAEIAACCQVPPLRAWRLAHGMPLEKAVERLVEICAETGLRRPKLRKGDLSKYELGRTAVPVWLLDPLCRLYRARPDWLGFGGDYSEGSTVPDAASATPFQTPLPLDKPDHGGHRRSQVLSSIGIGGSADMRRRELLRQLAVTTGIALTPGHLVAVEQTRQRLHETTTGSGIPTDILDRLESLIPEYERRFYELAPLPRLSALLTDFDEVSGWLGHRLPVMTQRRLWRVAAHLADLAADTLSFLGQFREAHAWLTTARMAADEAGDRVLATWIRGCQAGHAISREDDISRGLRFAQETQEFSRNPCPGLVSALDQEALVHARMGNESAARAALAKAKDTFERVPESQRRSPLWGMQEHKLHAATSNVMTILGHTREARAAQPEVFRHYPRNSNTWIRTKLDQAKCLIHDKDYDAGCASATRTVLDLPPEYRTPLVLNRAREVLLLIPEPHRKRPAARELSDLLTTARRA
ncbi:hypothetical protein TH66_00915 [Carbonactinospora thermoautotrophica]|uniref:XRE family transcriptional regulator n=1 Tax=Carbonactinospora thermoautotrophica TaxID=1469144 RepID=A0A132NB03_9ACTN|nr:hypothetical protein [Carbonactinospora thermoautotrophica]KWX01417.1 hypothetical protein LI90_2445 [Carbonactinospora thermoautotrophica]KWX05659.1 hypothetical protein TH66_00915 [Carbonactinospora thermoautotrophica]KWX07288.1 hypothetical protein TR74_19270 [Carbonactinospora thermoautotrophica]